MSKALEKVPETLAELKAMLPELTAQAVDEGKQSVDVTAQSTQAATTERERILGLAAIQFGEAAGAKFASLVATNMTVEQFKAVKALNPDPPLITATAIDAAALAEQKKRDEMLNALLASGAANVGADGLPLNATSGKDWLTLVDEYAALNKCSKVEAMQAVTGKYPDKHRAYIVAANQRRA